MEFLAKLIAGIVLFGVPLIPIGILWLLLSPQSFWEKLAMILVLGILYIILLVLWFVALAILWASNL